MFEITYSDNETFEAYQNAGKAHKGGTYDFTFENRYIIYHANLRHKVDYIAIDMSTGLASFVITKNPGNLYTEASYKRLIPHILYSVKYTGDMRYLNRFADDPLAVIDSIFRVVLPNNGYNIREEQIALAKKMYIGFTEKQVALCEAEVIGLQAPQAFETPEEDPLDLAAELVREKGVVLPVRRLFLH